jgi:hypothetical protein
MHLEQILCFFIPPKPQFLITILISNPNKAGFIVSPKRASLTGLIKPSLVAILNISVICLSKLLKVENDKLSRF